MNSPLSLPLGEKDRPWVMAVRLFLFLQLQIHQKYGILFKISEIITLNYAFSTKVFNIENQLSCDYSIQRVTTIVVD